MAGNHLLFSYGTLKTGEPNYKVMTNPETGSAVFKGVGRTVKSYPLVVASQFYVPFLLLIEGKGKQVDGEVYEVDDAKLAYLDGFEGHPNFYRREEAEISVFLDEHSDPIQPPKIMKCWIYFLPVYKPEMLNLPYLDKYSSISPDHPPYVESEDIHCLEQVD